MLSAREQAVVDRHLAAGPLTDGVRVPQDEVVGKDGAVSVYMEATGRLWVHLSDARHQTKQELVFHGSTSIVHTLTCSHPIKLWEHGGRRLTPRETARLQGFPEGFRLPRTRWHRILANSLAVPCARHAVSRVVDEGDAELRFLDLAAGIGGFHLATTQVCEQARCVGFSEIFPASIRCYHDNWPGTRSLGDATAVRAWPRCDLLLAGFPCQAFSKCNPPAVRAQHATRSFYEVVLDAVRGSQAQRVVLENVPTLQTDGRQQWAALQAALRDEGFVLDAAVLDAHDFGLAQRRRRLFLVGRRDGVPPRPLGDYTARPGSTLADVLD